VALRIHARVAWQIVGEEAVLLDLETGRAVGLNETGSFLWQRLESLGEDELARELAAEFCVEPDRAREDVVSFLALLGERGFLAS
jgi:hypothetical protein